MSFRSVIAAMSEFARRMQECTGFGSGWRWVGCALLIISLEIITPTSLVAAENEAAFLEGLRREDYLDIALEYIDQLEQHSGTSAELKLTLPFERGLTFMTQAQALTGDAKRDLLDQANNAFEAFAKKAGNDHPLAGRANTIRATLLLERAQADLWDAATLEGKEQKIKLEQARVLIEQARKVFAVAKDQYFNFSKNNFPTYIPEEKVELKQARLEVEGAYLEAKLDLAKCFYWEARSHLGDSTSRSEILKKAEEEFQNIKNEHASQTAGLVAELWLGICYMERETKADLGKALGVFDSLLKNTDSPAIKDQAMRFRLMCLNHVTEKKFAAAIEDGELWLKESRGRMGTAMGRGIQWEVCRAHDTLGQDESLTAAEQRRHQQLALNRVRQLQGVPEFRVAAGVMEKRLALKLKGHDQEPADFASAFALVEMFSREVAEKEKERKKAADAGNVKREATLFAERVAKAKELTKYAELALKLANEKSDPADVAQTRLILVYALLSQDKSLESAHNAEEQLQAAKRPEDRKKAAQLALSAWQFAYEQTTDQGRAEVRQQLMTAAERLAQNYPNSAEGTEGLLAVAELSWKEDRPLEAAEWWSKVPATSGRYAPSQVEAGQAYWKHYVVQSRKPAGERPANEQLGSWKQEAIKHLEAGIQSRLKNLPTNPGELSTVTVPADLILGKLALSQIRNLDGFYQTKDATTGALELLMAKPYSVVEGVDVGFGEKRPKQAGHVKSRQVASFCWQQILRAQIGLKNLDEARNARMKLEDAAGEGEEDSVSLTSIYLEFGQELQKELETLKAAGDTARMHEVRRDFEGFLTDLSERKDGHSFSSLLWVAETYGSLADSASDEPAKAKEFWKKSEEAMTKLLDRAKKEPDFVRNPSDLLQAKIRMASIFRRSHKFVKSEDLLLSLLHDKPDAISVQFEATRLYQDWASQKDPDSGERFQVAMTGRVEKGAKPAIWGWGQIIQRLEKYLQANRVLPDQQPSTEVQDARRMFADARYGIATCERDFGNFAPKEAERKSHLRNALMRIKAFVQTTKEITDTDYERFNTLFKSCLKDLGQPSQELPRSAKDFKFEAQKEEPVNPLELVRKEVQKQPESNTNLWLVGGFLVGGLGAVLGIYQVAAGAGKRKRRARLNAVHGSASASVTPSPPTPAPAPAVRAAAVRPTAVRPTLLPESPAPAPRPTKPRPKRDGDRE